MTQRIFRKSLAFHRQRKLLFLRAVSDGNVMQEGTIAEITITTADGRKYETNLKLTANDLQLFDDVRQIVK